MFACLLLQIPQNSIKESYYYFDEFIVHDCYFESLFTLNIKELPNKVKFFIKQIKLGQIKFSFSGKILIHQAEILIWFGRTCITITKPLSGFLYLNLNHKIMNYFKKVTNSMPVDNVKTESVCKTYQLVD